MPALKCFLVLILFLFLTCGCAKHEPVQAEEKSDYTFLFYMVGDSNLEEYIMTMANDLEKGLRSDKIKIFLFLDREEGYDSTDGDWKGARLYEITTDNNPVKINSRIIKEYGIINSANIDLMEEVMRYSFINNSGKKNVLVLSGHGGGWIGFGFDNSHNKSHVNMSGFGEVLKQLKSEGMPKLDSVFFYSCLMGQLEVAYDFIDYADYMVASEDLMYIADNGFMVKILLMLSENTELGAKEFSKQLLEKYFESLPFERDVLTLSVIDLSKLKGALQLFEMVRNQGLFSEDKFSILKARSQAKEFEDSEVDLVDLLNIMSFDIALADEKELITELKQSFKDSVISSRSGTSQWSAQGLSIYFPRRLDYLDYNYSAIPFNKTGWFDMMYLVMERLQSDNDTPKIKIGFKQKKSSAIELRGDIVDSNPVELRALEGRTSGSKIILNKVTKLPITIANYSGEPHLFDLKYTLSNISLFYDKKNREVGLFDISDYDYLLYCQYQESESKEIFPCEMYFDKYTGEYIYSIGYSTKDSAPFFIEIKDDDKFIMTRYEYSLDNLKLEKGYGFTITVKDVSAPLLETMPTDQQELYLLASDMANNRSIEKIN
jgi:hypothetical protein